jgi:hypothetical protein
MAIVLDKDAPSTFNSPPRRRQVKQRTRPYSQYPLYYSAAVTSPDAAVQLLLDAGAKVSRPESENGHMLIVEAFDRQLKF